MVAWNSSGAVEECIQNAVRDGFTPLLLYPGGEAKALDGPTAETEIFDGKLPVLRRLLLVLIDGTWSQARSIIRDSPGLLEATTCAQFTASAQSELHRVRSQPKPHCLSTAEACAQALRLIEPTSTVVRATSHLEAALKRMVDIQTQYAKEQRDARIRKPRQRREQKRVGVRAMRRSVDLLRGCHKWFPAAFSVEDHSVKTEPST